MRKNEYFAKIKINKTQKNILNKNKKKIQILSNTYIYILFNHIIKRIEKDKPNKNNKNTHNIWNKKLKKMEDEKSNSNKSLYGCQFCGKTSLRLIFSKCEHK